MIPTQTERKKDQVEMKGIRGDGKTRTRYPDYAETASGVQYKDVKVGSGETPKDGERVVIDWWVATDPLVLLFPWNRGFIALSLPQLHLHRGVVSRNDPRFAGWVFSLATFLQTKIHQTLWEGFTAPHSVDEVACYSLCGRLERCCRHIPVVLVIDLLTGDWSHPL